LTGETGTGSSAYSMKCMMMVIMIIIHWEFFLVWIYSHLRLAISIGKVCLEFWMFSENEVGIPFPGVLCVGLYLISLDILSWKGLL